MVSSFLADCPHSAVYPIHWQARRRSTINGLGRSTDGRRVRRKVSGGSAREVREKLRRLRDEIERGARAMDGSVTVGTFLTDWLAREVPRFARSVNTRENYGWAIEGHLVSGRGRRPAVRAARSVGCAPSW
jgi:hypothetical protein